MAWIVGVDGGATKTRAVLARGPGDAVARWEGGPCSLSTMPWRDAVQSAARAVWALCEQASLKPTQLTTVAIGVAGYSSVSARRDFHDALPQAVGGCPCLVTSDAVAAWAGAGGLKPCTALVAGTGSIAVAGDGRGGFARAGGWGPLLGDEGSGWWLGVRALAHLIAVQEGECATTGLAQRLSTLPGLGSQQDIVAGVYVNGRLADGAARREVASLAALVCDMAAAGDVEAVRLADEAAVHLSALAARAMAKLRLDPVFRLGGGLLSHGGHLLEATAARLRVLLPGSDIRPFESAAEDGCVALAGSQSIVWGGC